MNEDQIRKIVRDEFEKNYKSGSPKVPRHQHNNVDNAPIKQSDVVPSIRASGSITFAEAKIYTLNINSNPNPTLILCYGTVVNSASSPTFRAHTMGSAQLGQSYYFQPATTSSVNPGPIQQFIQSSSYFSVDSTATVHALTDEENLVDVEFPVGTIHARMTLTGFDRNSITLNVSHLDAGWNIIVNLIVI